MMKKIIIIALCLQILAVLCLCGCSRQQAEEIAPTEPPVAVEEVPAETTPEPTEPPMAIEAAPEPASAEASADISEAASEETSAAREGWADSYLEFLDNNYDIISALWPEGLAGVGFIDLDLDATPEMLLFDQGASAAQGVHIFDLIDGIVYCVSSSNDQAAGAFGDEHFSDASVWASYYESFILSQTDDGDVFWVESGNGDIDYTWNELIRFDNTDDILSAVIVCGSSQEYDSETGEITAQTFSVDGEECSEQEYNEARAVYTDAPTVDYQPAGVFLWDDMEQYDVTYEGLLAMAEDAAAMYQTPALG